MNKGFTLIELLAVIIVLGIISLITIFSVNSALVESKDSLSETQKKNIEDAAQLYYLKEGMNSNCNCISVSELINKGYMDGKSVKDPKTNEKMTGYVKITYNSNQYTYKYQTESCGICRTSIYQNGTVVYYDPVEGEKCSTYHLDNSLSGYNGITKSTSNQNSCLKWHTILDDIDNQTIDLLLDHNISLNVPYNTTGVATDGPISLVNQLKSDTSGWDGVTTRTDSYTKTTLSSSEVSMEYTVNFSGSKARIIFADEIAQITGNTFDENDYDGVGEPVWSYGYKWLVDDDPNYWTASAYGGNVNFWVEDDNWSAYVVFYDQTNGTYMYQSPLTINATYGTEGYAVRPVITVPIQNIQ